MAWVKIDDQAPRNHKLLKAGPAAAWMWVCGIAYCQAHMTEGFIPEIALEMVGIRGVDRAKKLAEVLASCGLFERVGGGYHVHDYLDFNETREEALERKSTLARKRAVAGRSGGLQSGVSRARSNEAKAKQGIEAERSPDPTRPDLIEPPNPLSAKGGRVSKREMRTAAEIRKQAYGRCPHEPSCATYGECVKTIALSRRAS